MRIEREVKVKNGGKEYTEERRFRSSRGRASHNVGPSALSCLPLPSSTSIALSLRTRLFHFNKANPS